MIASPIKCSVTVPDIALTIGSVGHVDIIFEEFHRRIAALGRLISFDDRGSGASDALSRAVEPPASGRPRAQAPNAMPSANSARRPARSPQVVASPLLMALLGLRAYNGSWASTAATRSSGRSIERNRATGVPRGETMNFS